MPNQPPHPPYSERYVLPKTKYGIPVTAEMFKDNEFTSCLEEDHKSKWWEKVWAEEEASQRHIRHERALRGDFDEVDRSQYYRATTAEELNSYHLWRIEREEAEREQAREKRFKLAAREMEEIMNSPTSKEKGGKKALEKGIRVSMKDITPWDFEDSDEDPNRERGLEKGMGVSKKVITPRDFDNSVKDPNRERDYSRDLEKGIRVSIMPWDFDNSDQDTSGERGDSRSLEKENRVSNKEITPWDFEDDDEDTSRERGLTMGDDGQRKKLRRWFKKILP